MSPDLSPEAQFKLFFEQGKGALHDEKMDEAITALLQAAELADRHEWDITQVAMELGNAFYIADQMAEAVRWWRRYLQKQKIDENLEIVIQTHVNVARALDRQNLPDEATAEFNHALQLGHEHQWERSHINFVACLEYGRFLGRIQKYEQAVVILEYALKITNITKPFPIGYAPSLVMHLAYMYAHLERHQEALELTEALIALEPWGFSFVKPPFTLIYLTQVTANQCFEDDKFEQAELIYRQTIRYLNRLQPSDEIWMRVLFNAGAGCYDVGRYEMAVRRLSASLAHAQAIPQGADYYLMMIRHHLIGSLFKLERFAEAEKIIFDMLAISERPDYQDQDRKLANWNNLGFAQLHLGKFAEAKEALDRSIVPGEVKKLSFYSKNLGLLYEKMQQRELAIAEYQKARALFLDHQPVRKDMLDFIDQALTRLQSAH